MESSTTQFGEPTDVAGRVRARREELGLRLTEVARATSIGPSLLRNLEHRFGRRAQEKYLARLATALAANERWLRVGEGDVPTEVTQQTAEQPLDFHSLEMRKLLGERAKRRRKHLRIKGFACAQSMGVSPSTLCLMETALRVTPNPEVESKWEAALQVEPGWLRNPEIKDRSGPVFLLDGHAVPASVLEPVQLSMELRQQLAERAKQRRVALGKTVGYAARGIGVQRAVLAQMERCLRKKPNPAVDEPWEAVLEVPTGWLRDIGQPTPDVAVEPKTRALSTPPDGWCTASDMIRGVGAWLSRSMGKIRNGAVRTTNLLDLTELERRNADMFAMRYGVCGENATTLESVGQHFGMTRERVRQIIAKLLEQAVNLQVETQILDHLREEIGKLTPGRTLDIEATLRPILGESLGIWSAQRFASEVLATKIAAFAKSPFSQSDVDRDTVVLDQSQADDSYARTIRSVCRGMVRSCGAANLFFVAGYISQEMGRSVDVKDVLLTAFRAPGFEWLSEPDGWFWFGEQDGENRLVNVARKVMAAAQCKVDVDQLHQAMGRSQRWLDNSREARRFFVEAPAEVLTKVLSRVSWLACIQKNDFVVTDENALAGVLSDLETLILRVIDANGGVAIKYEIDAYVHANMQVTPMGVAMALARSPCFLQPSHGAYSVCGRAIEPQPLERAALLRSTLSNHGSSILPGEDGWCSYKFELTDYNLKHKMIGLPAALARIAIAGDYAVEGFDEQIRITARESGLVLISRMMPTLQRLKAVSGSWLEVRIHPGHLRATMSLTVAAAPG